MPDLIGHLLPLFSPNPSPTRRNGLGLWGAGGLVHPRTRVGGGARRRQVPATAGTQETVGGAGVERSGTESPRHPTVPIPSGRWVWIRRTKRPEMPGQAGHDGKVAVGPSTGSGTSGNGMQVLRQAQGPQGPQGTRCKPFDRLRDLRDLRERDAGPSTSSGTSGTSGAVAKA